MTWSDGRRLATVTKNGNTYTYAYNGDGLRVEKTDGDTTYRYLYDGGNLIRIEKESGTYLEYVDFLYDEATLFGFRFCDPYTSGYGTYYYLYGHGGNVEGILDGSGNLLVRYIYDAWGNFTEELTFEGQQNPFNVQAIFMNPFRYRGYVYDFETGFYYLQSRYYDPETGRFISVDDQMAGVGGDLLGYNLFAYCQNDPVNMVDPTGHAPKWLKKAIAVVAIAAVIATATVLTVTTFGAGSVAAIAMTTAASTLVARTIEVTALQIKKGVDEGDSSEQIAKDVIESIYDNKAEIIGLTPLFKVSSIGVGHVTTSLVSKKVFGLSHSFDATLKSPCGKAFSYAFVAKAWGDTIISVFSDDPNERAEERNYTLK